MPAKVAGATKDDAKTLYDKLIGQGASEKQARSFSGYKPEPTLESAPANGSPAGADSPRRTVSVPRVPMNTSKAQRIIFGVVIAVTALTIIGDVMAGRSKQTDAIPRRVVAGTLAGIMLMILAIPAPRFAASITGVLAISWVFVNPDGILIINKLTGTATARNATVVATNDARDAAIHSGPGGPAKRAADSAPIVEPNKPT